MEARKIVNTDSKSEDLTPDDEKLIAAQGEWAGSMQRAETLVGRYKFWREMSEFPLVGSIVTAFGPPCSSTHRAIATKLKQALNAQEKMIKSAEVLSASTPDEKIVLRDKLVNTMMYTTTTQCSSLSSMHSRIFDSLNMSRDISAGALDDSTTKLLDDNFSRKAYENCARIKGLWEKSVAKTHRLPMPAHLSGYTSHQRVADVFNEAFNKANSSAADTDNSPVKKPKA